MKRFVLIASIIGVVLAAFWCVAQPGYEPAITMILGIIGVVGSLNGQSTNTKSSESNDALLRPQRLDARNALIAFAEYCIRYQTLHARNEAHRTHDLSAEIGKLNSKIDALGHLSMPQLQPLIKDITTQAWNFQRLLDRQGGSAQRPINREFQNVEDNLDGIVDWFAGLKRRIKEEIDPHLEI
jgi:hypothetical protein